VSQAWVAGSVRAAALARRRIGAAGARRLAAAPTLADALTALATSPYGHDVAPGATLAEAQRGVAAGVLWHLRVLAGWAPRDGVDRLRVLAGGFELANLDGHLDSLRGLPADRPFRLGTLGTAWGRLRATSSVSEVRAVLATSGWGDPGTDTAWGVALGARLGWAARVHAAVPEAREWASGAAALLVARETLLAARWLPDPLAARATLLLGPGWRAATTVRELGAAVPREAGWALTGTGEPRELWRAEAAWWRRVERDAFAMLRRGGFGPEPVVGAVGVLAADAWRVRAALEVAARGGRQLEAFDAVA
jgi:hypothetical protein